MSQAFRVIVGALFLGTIRAHAQIEIKNGRIDVVFESNDTGLPRERLLAWVEEAGHAVSDYYGRFPVRRVEVRIRPVGGDPIGSGKTFGTRSGGLIKVDVGRSTTEAHFARDWLMTREMVHLAFPDVPERHHWVDSPARAAGSLPRSNSGRISCAICHKDCRKRAIAVWISLRLGGGATGAGRFFVCLPMWKFIAAPRMKKDSQMRSAAFWKRAVQLMQIGLWSGCFPRVIAQPACRFCKSCTRR
ncbi:MAG: hypothetical protein ABI946_09370 [Chthoniobacterales bacterium]